MNRGTVISTCAAVLGVGAVAISLPMQGAVAGVTPMANAFTYQGRLDVGGAPYSGTADFVFRLFDGSGGGAAQVGPIVPVNNVTVIDGVFTVTLDFGAVFHGDERYLEIQVDTPAAGGVGPFTTLTPRQLLAATPYAAFALGVNGATITNLNATNLSTGTVPSARVSGAYTNAVNFSNGGNLFTGTFSGSGASLTSLNAANISTGILPIVRGGTGASTAGGALTNLNAQQRVTGTAPVGQYIRAINADGTVVTGVDANSGGDITGVTAGAGLTGGGASGAVNIAVANNGITNVMLAIDSASLAKVSGGAASASGSNVDVAGNLFAGSSDSVRLTNNTLTTYGADGLIQTRLFGSSWGQLELFDSSAGNIKGADLAAQEQILLTKTSGGALTLWNELGTLGAKLFTPVGTDSGTFYMYNASGSATINMDATNSSLYLSNPNNGAYMELLGNIGGESRFTLYNDLGNDTVFIDTDSLNHGRILLADETGATKINIGVESDNTGQILLYNAAGTATIQIDAGFGDADGRIVTDELQITGGADLSEQFDITSHDATSNVEPGMVVCIDPDNPGELIVATRAYDRCVAGIVSGAGGIKPGMLMGQKDSKADGQHPVALTGRVYVRVTDANGSIEPGDLLTSSDVPGCAMKVTDFAQAQGAIIGKAMTRPDEHSGLVLVLVGLQ